MNNKFKSIRITDNFYQSSSFFPMPLTLIGTLNEDGTLTPKINLKTGSARTVINGNELMNDKTKFQNNLMNRRLYVYNTTGNDTFGSDINALQENSSMEYVQDTSSSS